MESSVNRRGALRMGAAALGGLALIRRAQASVNCTATASQTQGPYWVEEMLNRSDIRSDPGTGVLQAGVPLRLAINVSETTAGVCAPVAGAYVDIWHCNAAGAYSDEPAGGGNPNTLGQKWLRGYQISDAHGNVRFLTVFPGWYMGRTVHIHFRIRKFQGSTATFNFTSQIYFSDALANTIFATSPYSAHTGRNPASNAGDGLYNGALLARHSGFNAGTHVLASFNAVINADPGLWGKNGNTPTDEDSMEHLNDFGGGVPPEPVRLA